MTEDDREKLTEELKALDAACEPLLQARKPLDDALAAIENIRAAVLERWGVEIIGNCEHCNRLMVGGDMHFAYADGPVICEPCAPTWSELVTHYQEHAPDETADDEDREAHTLGLTVARAHVEAGDGDKKHVWPLS